MRKLGYSWHRYRFEKLVEVDDSGELVAVFVTNDGEWYAEYREWWYVGPDYIDYHWRSPAGFAEPTVALVNATVENWGRNQ